MLFFFICGGDEVNKRKHPADNNEPVLRAIEALKEQIERAKKEKK